MSDDVKRVLDGRYEIAGKLGEGGMGQVYRGRDLLKNRPVAVKLLLDDPTGDEVTRERFRREANVLKELEHTSLVKLLDAKTDGREPFLVFEFVEGERLDRVIGSGPMEPRRALSLAGQIASAVAALHARGVVHRDVKPSNIIIRGDGSLCLLDFGTAKHAGDAERTAEQLTTEGFVVGTLQYMPPEALFRSAPLAPAYDVWAVGVVLWEMLVGRRPFADIEQKGMTAFMDALRTSEMPPILELLPALPSPLVGLVRGLVERDAGARPKDGQAALDWIRDVEGALDHATTSGARTSILSRKAINQPTPAAGFARPSGTSGSTMVMKKDVAGGRRTGLVAAVLAAALIGGAGVWFAVAPSSPGPRANPHLEAVQALARTCQHDVRGLAPKLAEAGRKVPTDAPDQGRKALEAALATSGVTAAQLHSLALAERTLAGLEPTSAGAFAILEPLLALEVVDHLASALELPAGFRLGVTSAIPAGYQQRAVPSEVDGERRVVSLQPDGQGTKQSLAFTVADPAAVAALSVSLSGEALKRGHLVLLHLNAHAFTMGGMEAGGAPAAPRELRRGLPALMLKAGENELDAAVIGAPAGAGHDPEGLKVTVRVSAP